MSIILDVIVVAIVLLYALRGWRKGFFRSLMGLIGAIVALLAALTVSRFLSQWIFDLFIRAPLSETVSQAMAENGAATASGIMNSLPTYLQGMVGWTENSAQELQGVISNGAGQAADILVNLISPLVINLIMIVMTIILFIIFLIIVRLILRLLNKVTRIPVIKQLNGILGFLLGIGKGILIVWILCALASIIVPLFGSSTTWLREAMDHSYVFNALANFNIVSLWLM